MPTSLLTRSWTYLALRGVAAVVFGVIAMAAPLSTVFALVLLWGLWALVDGVGSLRQAFTSPPSTGRWSLVISGLLSLAVAFLAIVRPGLSAVTLTWVLGIWLIARGLLELFMAVVDDVDSRWGLLSSAALDVLLGALFIANPGRAALSVAFVLGLSALVWGLALCALAVWVRRSSHQSAATSAGRRHHPAGEGS